MQQWKRLVNIFKDVFYVVGYPLTVLVTL